VMFFWKGVKKLHHKSLQGSERGPIKTKHYRPSFVRAHRRLDLRTWLFAAPPAHTGRRAGRLRPSARFAVVVLLAASSASPIPAIITNCSWPLAGPSLTLPRAAPCSPVLVRRLLLDRIPGQGLGRSKRWTERTPSERRSCWGRRVAERRRRDASLANPAVLYARQREKWRTRGLRRKRTRRYLQVRNIKVSVLIGWIWQGHTNRRCDQLTLEFFSLSEHDASLYA
jgi:hypothetical protein